VNYFPLESLIKYNARKLSIVFGWGEVWE